MGYDASCDLTLDGRQYRGTARLESTQLRFAGDTRLVIPLREIVAARAERGVLHVSFGGTHAQFLLGPEATTWASRITNPPSRLDKLGITAGMRAVVINVDDETLVGELESRHAELRGRAASDVDVFFFGVEHAADLDRLGALCARLKPTGAIWLIRRKGRDATISEAQSMAAGKRAGLVDIKVVSFSETHSAEKYVIPVARRAGSGRSSSPRSRTRGSASSRGRR